ncbi:MAG: HAD family hydrolase [Dehalococcoidia bacterium]|nr:HAD family hydrolase [Dehalococcoidia bacterium]
MALNGITTITFDADDTLWDFETGMIAALRRLRAEIVALADGGARVPSVEAMQATRAAVDDDPRLLGATLDASRREAIRRSASQAGLDDPGLVDELFDMYIATRVASTPIFPETLPALAVLGERFQLGVITNSNTDPAEIGLSSQFSFAVCADAMPYRKPDPRVFQHAATIGGYDLERSAHVGDSLVTDVDGANRAGAISIWLNQSGDADGRTNPADHTITSLSELPALLGIA